MKLKQEILSCRQKLGLVFDDNLGTRQWYNIVDWVIVFMILLSSVEIFLATLPVGPEMQRILNVINEVTLWFFIVEVTLRIWAAPEQYIGDPGQFADTSPVTIAGRIIACLVGVMGIAIVAVPAGILGAGISGAAAFRSRGKERR